MVAMFGWTNICREKLPNINANPVTSLELGQTKAWKQNASSTRSKSMTTRWEPAANNNAILYRCLRRAYSGSVNSAVVSVVVNQKVKELSRWYGSAEITPPKTLFSMWCMMCGVTCTYLGHAKGANYTWQQIPQYRVVGLLNNFLCSA